MLLQVTNVTELLSPIISPIQLSPLPSNLGQASNLDLFSANQTNRFAETFGGFFARVLKFFLFTSDFSAEHSVKNKKHWGTCT